VRSWTTAFTTATFTCTYLSEASTLYCNVIGMLNLKAPSTIRQEKIRYWNEC
jgi:hypothetical protein